MQRSIPARCWPITARPRSTGSQHRQGDDCEIPARNWRDGYKFQFVTLRASTRSTTDVRAGRATGEHALTPACSSRFSSEKHGYSRRVISARSAPATSIWCHHITAAPRRPRRCTFDRSRAVQGARFRNQVQAAGNAAGLTGDDHDQSSNFWVIAASSVDELPQARGGLGQCRSSRPKEAEDAWRAVSENTPQGVRFPSSKNPPASRLIDQTTSVQDQRPIDPRLALSHADATRAEKPPVAVGVSSNGRAGDRWGAGPDACCFDRSGETRRVLRRWKSARLVAVFFRNARQASRLPCGS